ncbi:hypothetical protein [Bacteroides sp.]|uniref:hypothetical protein n=1 Tax=Bacteroides sp. TaxID=29523 RepID=UPI0026108772|nr:hypothetical protein [Bacteroides sp.]
MVPAEVIEVDGYDNWVRFGLKSKRPFIPSEIIQPVNGPDRTEIIKLLAQNINLECRLKLNFRFKKGWHIKGIWIPKIPE